MIDPRWREVRRLLAVRLDNLGDVLLASPALHAIKATAPEIHLALLTSPTGAQAGRLHSDVDEVIVYRAPWVDPWGELAHDLDRERTTRERLHAGRFDAAIIFTSFRQSALPAAYLCYLAGIPLRLAASIDGSGSLLTTRHRHPERLLHEVERGLDLATAAGFTTTDWKLVLAVPEGSRRDAERIVRALHRRTGPVVVLHPGCTMPARTYPAERYVAVAERLVERLDATILLTGTAEERELVAAIAGAMRYEAVTLAGALDFPTFCGTIAAADLVVTNNTGPMHLAAATGTPVVALFALTNDPAQWGPWQVPHRTLFHDVPCRFCHARRCPFGHECLTGVSPETVAEAAAELLGIAASPAATAIGSEAR